MGVLLLLQRTKMHIEKLLSGDKNITTLHHGQDLLLDSYVVKKFLRSLQHEAGNLGPKLQPRALAGVDFLDHV